MKNRRAFSRLILSVLLGVGLLVGQLVSASSASARTLSPQPALDPAVIHPAAATLTANWAGWGTFGSRGVYTRVSLSFVVPSVSFPLSSAPAGTVAGLSIWAGLGGDQSIAANKTSYALLQAGVSITVDNTTGKQTNQAFWEYENQASGFYGNGPQYLSTSSFPINTGDSLSILVESNYGGNGQNLFHIQDGSRWAYNSYWSTYFSDSATAECVGENHSFGYLASFHPESLNNCTVGTNSTSMTINYWSAVNKRYVITDNAMSAGSLNGSGSFTLTWHSAA